MTKIIAKKLKVVDIVENEAVAEVVEVKTDAEQLSAIKEEMEPSEPVIMKPKRKAKSKAKPKPIEGIKEEIKEEEQPPIEETPIEEPPIKQTKQQKAKYMREYRKIASGTEQLLLNELNILKEEKQKSIVSVKQPQPQIKNTVPLVKEAPDYNNIPDEIIEKEIKKRQTAKSQNRQFEKIKNLIMNIA